jgi:hypothetical protein
MSAPGSPPDAVGSPGLAGPGLAAPTPAGTHGLAGPGLAAPTPTGTHLLGQTPPSEIIPDFLYLGGAEQACNINTLNKFGITHVINITNNASLIPKKEREARAREEVVTTGVVEENGRNNNPNRAGASSSTIPKNEGDSTDGDSESTDGDSGSTDGHSGRTDGTNTIKHSRTNTNGNSDGSTSNTASNTTASHNNSNVPPEIESDSQYQSDSVLLRKRVFFDCKDVQDAPIEVFFEDAVKFIREMMGEEGENEEEMMDEEVNEEEVHEEGDPEGSGNDEELAKENSNKADNENNDRKGHSTTVSKNCPGTTVSSADRGDDAGIADGAGSISNTNSSNSSGSSNSTGSGGATTTAVPARPRTERKLRGLEEYAPPSIRQFLEEVVERRENKKNRLLIHCMAGRSRSATLLLAWMMIESAEKNKIPEMKITEMAENITNGDDKNDHDEKKNTGDAENERKQDVLMHQKKQDVLMHHPTKPNQITLRAALDYVLPKRYIFPNLGFLDKLQALERSLFRQTCWSGRGDRVGEGATGEGGKNGGLTEDGGDNGDESKKKPGGGPGVSAGRGVSLSLSEGGFNSTLPCRFQDALDKVKRAEAALNVVSGGLGEESQRVRPKKIYAEFMRCIAERGKDYCVRGQCGGGTNSGANADRRANNGANTEANHTGLALEPAAGSGYHTTSASEPAAGADLLAEKSMGSSSGANPIDAKTLGTEAGASDALQAKLNEAENCVAYLREVFYGTKY